MLTPKAIQGYAPFFDYEAHMLVRSLYYETEMGEKAIDPEHFVARYALKYVARVSSSLMRDSHTCNMLLTVTCSRYHLGHVQTPRAILW
jgi:hypothetical protein